MNHALYDLSSSLSKYRVWLHLGWMEVKQRYRRSVIGPWWITLSMLLFIVMLSIVFSRLFHQSLHDYVPFFTAGYLFWIFISSSIQESAEVFRANAGFIKQINLPFHLYIFKHLVRQVIFLLHNSVVYVLVCIYFTFNPGWVCLLAIPGFVLLLLNVYWITFLAAIIASRYRDMVPIITSCVQIAFFITPISWMPRLLDQNPAILKLNPLVYFLDIVRAPLLGQPPAFFSCVFCSVTAIVGIVVSLYLFSFARPRIAYWVD